MLDVRARSDAPAEGAAGAEAAECALFVAAAAFEERPARGSRGSRDDVDDAVDRVRAPERATRARDDLYPVDVLEQRVLHIPEHTGVQRGIDAAPLDEHEQLVSEIA